jgi:hypothetical protein
MGTSKLNGGWWSPLIGSFEMSVDQNKSNDFKNTHKGFTNVMN